MFPTPVSRARPTERNRSARWAPQSPQQPQHRRLLGTPTETRGNPPPLNIRTVGTHQL